MFGLYHNSALGVIPFTACPDPAVHFLRDLSFGRPIATCAEWVSTSHPPRDKNEKTRNPASVGGPTFITRKEVTLKRERFSRLG
jgi:hypothetical protein